MILVVEDAPQVAGIIVSKLEREGFKLLWKRDGDSAQDSLNTFHPELILLSTTLEKRDAWEVLEKFCHQHPPIPVVMILEQEEASEQNRAKAMGCHSCIIKPFKPTSLAKTVKAILENGRGLGLGVGDWPRDEPLTPNP
ncbi:MAG: response regulator [Elusimicrobia bacterium]|nr:response regulator [Elusimicrobiota bacterium]